MINKYFIRRQSRSFSLGLFFFCIGYFCVANHAMACKSTRAIGVFFEKNSAVISAEQSDRLAEWVQELKQKYVAGHILEMEARVEVGESGGKDLGRRREIAAWQELNRLSLTARELAPPVEVVVEKARPPGTAGGVEARSVWVYFLPGCPHGCPCQLDWNPKAGEGLFKGAR